MKAWPIAHLGEVVSPVDRGQRPVPGTSYKLLGVHLWGEGVYDRGTIDGANTRYSKFYRVETNDLVVNKIWLRNGSAAVVPPYFAGYFCTTEFPTFSPDVQRILPRWLHWLVRSPPFWARCEARSRGTSGRNRVRPEQLLAVEIPLPTLSDQERVVRTLDGVAAASRSVAGRLDATSETNRALLLGAYSELIERVTWLPMSEVAPLKRRRVRVQPDESYPELGVRSFGKGTFHKPALPGTAVGSKKLFRIMPGDLVFNNVFAWEGAVGVARPEDSRRFGSHRFITCEPRSDLVVAKFLKYHFLTSRGLDNLGSASPGGAGRNRTLSLDGLGRILVPVPALERQKWFAALIEKVDEIADLGIGMGRALRSLESSLIVEQLGWSTSGAAIS